VYRRLERRKRGLYKRSVSLRGSSVKGTWSEGSFTGNSESYIRHVKEGYRKGGSLFIEDL
jgi:hypothetical protein